MSSVDEPDRLHDMASTWRAGHRCGALDAFGAAIRILVENQCNGAADLVEQEALRRFGPGPVADELRARGLRT